MKLIPGILVIEPTSICNLRCTMCESRCTTQRDVLKKKDMTMKEFELIWDKIGPYTYDLLFQGECEPTINKNLSNMVGHINKEAKYISLVTNGTLLNRDLIIELFQNGLNYISFSIDSHIKEQYENIRLGANFDRVLENLKITKEIIDSKFKNVTLNVHKVIFKEDTDEYLEDFLLYFKKTMGADRISMNPKTWYGKSDISLEEFHSRLEKIVKYNSKFIVEKHADYYDYIINSFPFIKSIQPYQFCYLHHNYVAYNGDFYPCMYNQNPGPFGNLIEDNLDDIINSRKYKSFYNYWINDKFKDGCISCTGCSVFNSLDNVNKINPKKIRFY